MTAAEKIKFLFQKLEEHYGWRGWWPSMPIGRITPEYHKSKKYKYSQAEKIEIAVGAILTQNTAWTNVVKALENLRKLGCIDACDLERISDETAAEAIRPSGYFNQKLKKLRRLCAYLKQNDWADLEKMDVMQLRAELLGIWGIGKETADSIILYAFEKPIFVIDAYTRRVFSRFGLISGKEEYDALRALIEKSVDKDINAYKNYHAVIVELCKDYCKTKPDCVNCFINEYCSRQI